MKDETPKIFKSTTKIVQNPDEENSEQERIVETEIDRTALRTVLEQFNTGKEYSKEYSDNFLLGDRPAQYAFDYKTNESIMHTGANRADRRRWKALKRKNGPDPETNIYQRGERSKNKVQQRAYLQARRELEAKQRKEKINLNA